MNRFFAFTAAITVGLAAPAYSQTCGGTYVVKEGDTLSLIAAAQYGNLRLWSAIHRENISKVGPNPNAITRGMQLEIPCINGRPTGLPSTPVAQVEPEPPTPAPTPKPAPQPEAPAPSAPADVEITQTVNLVTSDAYPPFTGRGLQGQGLMTEMVEAAMRASPGSEDYQIHWINDWSSHLDPLLSNAMMDMAFPWPRPDCDQDAQNTLCAEFQFSAPLFETLNLLFVDRARPISFAQDSDLHGRTLCRPEGLPTHDLDRADRKWLTEALITLETPHSIERCFEMLIAGEVDAVALNEFSGRDAVKTLGLAERVEAIQARPLSIETLHVVVHKEHPQAERLLETINEGMAASRASGTFQRVMDTQLSTIWAEY